MVIKILILIACMWGSLLVYLPCVDAAWHKGNPLPQEVQDSEVWSMLARVVFPILFWIFLLILQAKMDKAMKKGKTKEKKDETGEIKEEGTREDIFSRITDALESLPKTEEDSPVNILLPPREEKAEKASQYPPEPVSNFEETLKTRFKTIRIIWAAITMGVFLFGIAAYQVSQQDPLPPAFPVQDNLKYIFTGIALMVLVFSSMLKSSLLEARGQILIKEETPAPPGMNRLISKIQAVSILIFSLCEVPALLGVALVSMTHQLSDYYLLGLISFTGLVFHFPRYEEWEYWMTAQMAEN